MKQNETPSWDAVGLPLEFLNESTRRANLNAQRKMLDKAIGEIDNYLLVQLKLIDAKSVKVGDSALSGCAPTRMSRSTRNSSSRQA